MSNKLAIKELGLGGVFEVRSLRYSDDRGSFARWYCGNELAALLPNKSVRQINHSVNTRKGTVRGLHFQYPPAAEHKLVRCVQGAVSDIIVDLRANSPTFLAHISVHLEASDDVMLLIPPGCAHGFQSLQDNSQLLYLHTADYAPEFEGGCRVDDPILKIKLALPISTISQRDSSFAFLEKDFSGIEV